MDGLFWNSYFAGRKEHHFRSTMKTYKRDVYERIFQRVLGAQPSGKTIWITDSYDQFYGFDPYRSLRRRNVLIESDASKLCMSRVRGKRRLSADASAPPLKDGSIDIIISPSTMDHCDKGTFGVFLRETERILKPRGTAVILLHNKENIFMRFELLKILERIPYSTYSKREMEAVLKRHSRLELSDVFYVLNMPFPFLSTAAINFLDRKELNGGIIGEFVGRYLKMSSRVSEFPYLSELLCAVLKKKA